MDSNEARHSTAHYFLEGLNELGFDYLFCNFGTDHAPLIEAMAAVPARRPQDAEDHPLPAREHRRAHGGGLRHRHRPRPGRDGACRCRHRQLGDGAAQSLPRPHPGDADGRQGAVHDARRASGHARHLRAFRAGAVRPGEHRAALHQVGIQPAVRRDRQGGAAPRPHGDGERSQGAGLHDLPARDADRELERGRDPLLSGRALRRGGGARRRCRRDRAARRPPARGRAAVADHRLCRAQPRDRRACSTSWRASPASAWSSSIRST